MNFSPMELYIFGLCFVVFAALTILLTTLIVVLARQHLRLVSLGAEDEKIREEYDNRHNQSKFLNALGFIINLTVCILLVIAFGFSVAVKVYERQNRNDTKLGSLHVVRSDSMAKAYEKNEYLFKNGLDSAENNFRLFDIIYTNPVPPEEDIELYDVIVYQLDEMLIVHRIVKIEKPNEKHPDEIYYYFCGDNNIYVDPKPVTYDQMRGIWNGQKIEHVGSFILFMQSPAGYLCIILMLFAVFVAPIAIKKIEDARRERYRILTGVDVAMEAKVLRQAARGEKRMDTYYNRPGSPYSVPRQRQHEQHRNPISTNPTYPNKTQVNISTRPSNVGNRK